MDIGIILLYSLLINIAYTIVMIVLLSKPGKIKEQEEELFKKTEEKSQEVITGAIKESERIVLEAREKGLDLLEEEKRGSQRMEGQFSQELTNFSTELKNRLAESTTLASTSYQEYLENLKKESGSHVEEEHRVLQEKANSIFEKTKSEMETFINDLHTRIGIQVDDEIKAARDVVKAYRRERLAAVDDKIVDLVEKTVAKTMGKTLDIGEKTDLVYKALEEAKKEEVF